MSGINGSDQPFTPLLPGYVKPDGGGCQANMNKRPPELCAGICEDLMDSVLKVLAMKNLCPSTDTSLLPSIRLALYKICTDMHAGSSNAACTQGVTDEVVTCGFGTDSISSAVDFCNYNPAEPCCSSPTILAAQSSSPSFSQSSLGSGTNPTLPASTTLSWSDDGTAAGSTSRAGLIAGVVVASACLCVAVVVASVLISRRRKARDLRRFLSDGHRRRRRVDGQSGLAGAGAASGMTDGEGEDVLIMDDGAGKVDAPAGARVRTMSSLRQAGGGRSMLWMGGGAHASMERLVGDGASSGTGMRGSQRHGDGGPASLGGCSIGSSGMWTDGGGSLFKNYPEVVAVPALSVRTEVAHRESMRRSVGVGGEGPEEGDGARTKSMAEKSTLGRSTAGRASTKSGSGTGTLVLRKGESFGPETFRTKWTGVSHYVPRLPDEIEIKEGDSVTLSTFYKYV
ncbi:hypothetical protein HK101_009243 [Irineochytrium annulatum]|nr:hypothetical protein HK101_009243 [Irineochytrium annulatum]